MFARRLRLPASAIAGSVLAVAALAAGTYITSAHVVGPFGPYTVAIGWLHEPTYVGQENAVQVIVKDAHGNGITDLNSGDLKVVVSTGGQQSSALNLEPAFDSDTGLGTRGDYHAPIIPTAVGDYTFHLSGSIHGTPVDKSFTSGPTTFNTVVDSSSVQFPNKIPAVSDVATKVDKVSQRLDTTVASAQSANDAARNAASAAGSATDSANRATILAIIGIALAVVLGIANLAVGMRRKA